MTAPIRPFLLCVLGMAALTAARAQSSAAPPAADPQETKIQSQSAEMRSTDKETLAIFDKDVVLIGSNLRISCDYLEIRASRIGDLQAAVPTLEKFQSLVAVGRVHIVQGDREVTCGRAEVYPREEKIILTEKPVVIDHSGPFHFTGSRLILLRGERRIFGEDVVVTGPPIRDLGFAKEAPMEAPAPIPTPAPAAPPR